MSSLNRTKLNQLFWIWPNGTVGISVYLEKLGIYQQLIDRYVKSKWVEQIGRGAYIKANDHVDWTGALYALQRQLNLDVHVGGRTAIELSGHTHFVSQGEKVVWLFGKRGEKLPKWFVKNKSKSLGMQNVQIKYSTSVLFDFSRWMEADVREIDSLNDYYGLVPMKFGSYEIIVASLERAILEMLYLIPSDQSLVEAKYLMEGLMTLQPDVLLFLLDHCRSIKVKRLFFFLADLCHLPCLEYLDLSKINLGEGKRVIGEGGYYIKKYQLSISKHFVNTFREEFENDK